MSDQFGFLEGAKSFSSSLDASREGAKSITKSIENIQQDGLDIAQRKARERRTAQREAEVKKQTAVIKALEEYKRRKYISDQEADLKIQFVKKYGAKEWDALLRIKSELEALEKHNIKEFQHDLRAIRRVQFWCFFVAAFIAWYLTWGIK